MLRPVRTGMASHGGHFAVLLIDYLLRAKWVCMFSGLHTRPSRKPQSQLSLSSRLCSFFLPSQGMALHINRGSSRVLYAHTFQSVPPPITVLSLSRITKHTDSSVCKTKKSTPLPQQTEQEKKRN